MPMRLPLPKPFKPEALCRRPFASYFPRPDAYPAMPKARFPVWRPAAEVAAAGPYRATEKVARPRPPRSLLLDRSCRSRRVSAHACNGPWRGPGPHIGQSSALSMRRCRDSPRDSAWFASRSRPLKGPEARAAYMKRFSSRGRRHFLSDHAPRHARACHRARDRQGQAPAGWPKAWATLDGRCARRRVVLAGSGRKDAPGRTKGCGSRQRRRSNRDRRSQRQAQFFGSAGVRSLVPAVQLPQARRADPVKAGALAPP